jgi:CO dehydrogenase/acetyl-CoA synthase alpha subunit
MTKLFRTTLDDRMDADIDAIIERLQKAKNARTYLQKSLEVGKIAQECQDYEGYWTERLYNLMD